MQQGMSVYAWNHGQDGPPETAAQLREARLDWASLETAYHASKCTRLHTPRDRVCFPRDRTVYVRPDPDSYGHMLPQVDLTAAESNILLTLADDAPDLEAVAWTVLLHNSRLRGLHRNLVGQTPLGYIL